MTRSKATPAVLYMDVRRVDVTMTSPFMDAYVQLLIKTCHRRGVHAMGGMAAQIPIKNDTAANDAALAKVFDRGRPCLRLTCLGSGCAAAAAVASRLGVATT